MNRSSSKKGPAKKDAAKPLKDKLSTRKYNAAGYENRRAKKELAAQSKQTNDVYEYVPEATRRSGVRLELDREEAADHAMDMDAGDKHEALRARLIGENGEDERLPSDDEDEDIDSDAAFEEADDERFLGFFPSKEKVYKKQKHAVRFTDVNLNENEDMEDENAEDNEGEEEEEGSDDEFINLVDVLDGKGDIDEGSDNITQYKPRIPEISRAQDQNYSNDANTSNVDNGEDASEEESNDEDSEIGSEASQDELPEALDELQNFISTLDPSRKKRKTHAESDAADPRSHKKRTIIKETTEAGLESEFRAGASGSKLNIEDLLAPLASQSSVFETLKQSIKVLAPGSSSKAKTLSAPLPQRTQERLDREAAYDQTKQELNKWSETMKRIRNAEHLSFPLQSEPGSRVSNLELNAKFKPTTALESSVDALLKSAKMREEDLQHTEESLLVTNNLTIEEVAQRRGELRKMRDLTFRAEVKARRVNKIKSKTFRRLKRKEKKRLGETIDDDDMEGEDGEEARLKREKDRAMERATLKHKVTGKWAKHMQGREMNADGRREMEEMLSRGEKLRQRIQGLGNDESDVNEEEEDVDDDSDIEAGIKKIKQRAFDELKSLEKADVAATEKIGKGVFEMKFMKDAISRQQQAVDKTADDFVQEMGLGAATSDGEVEAEASHPTSGVVAKRSGGRVVYRPSTINTQVTRPMGSHASDASSVTLKSTDLFSPPPFSPTAFRSIPQNCNTSNPWLARDPSDLGRVSTKKSNDIVVGKDSKFADKSKAKLGKQSKKKEEEKEKMKEDAVVEICVATVLGAPSAGPSADNWVKPVDKVVESPDNGDDSDTNSEVEAQELSLAATMKGKGKAAVHAFEQRDLVALAFAGDNVVQEFEETKRREMAADAPREVDTTIPGWGSWGGTGTRRVAPKPQRIKRIAGIEPTTRADYGKKHIIISEKRDKKAAKYLVKDLPYPYTSKAQFERAMERPLGSEWNTRVGFQRGTLPRILKKPGVIIHPLEKRT